MDIEEKCWAVLNWAEDKPWFDTEFVDSVLSQYEEKGFASDAQENAIDNILEKFNI